MNETSADSQPLSGLHVVIVPAWWPSPEQPIAGVFFEDYARAFVAAGAKVGVVYPDLVSLRHIGKGTTPPLAPRVCHERFDGIPVVRVRGLHTALGRPAWQMGRFRSWLRRGLKEYSRRHGSPDLLHAKCAIPSGWAATRLGSYLARRVVVTEHTGPFSLALTPPAAARFVLEALRDAAAVVAVSQNLRREMLAAGVRRDIAVIGNPVGPEFVGSAPPDRYGGPAVGIFVGRLTPEKGVGELIEAALELETERSGSIEWHFVGDGPLAPEVERLRAGLPPGRVVLHGLCDKATVAQRVAAAHFLVLPSHGENCPLAVCEALAVGRPVVGTRGTGIEALVGPGDGVLCDIGDSKGLAAAIRATISEAAAWDWHAISRRAVERFSADSIARRYSEIFRCL